MKKLLIPVILACCMIPGTHGRCADTVPTTLATARSAVQSEFDRLDGGLKRAAARLAAAGLTGDAARTALAELCAGFSYAVDCAAVDPTGKMATIEPALYRHFEGADISGQEQIRRMMQTGKPVLSEVFLSVEGLDTADAEYPITSGDGSFRGSVSLLFRPEKFLGDIIRPLVKGLPMDVWAMETGGRILYDVDKRQINLNLFTSPLYRPYPSLIELGRQIARDPSGAGTYTFLDRTKRIVTKSAYWQTATLYGSDWRLVGIHVERNKAGQRDMPATGMTPRKPLESFAAGKALIAALVREEPKAIMKLFRKFHRVNPGIYSIQWVDATGLNRFGYPEENSLKDYDLRSGRAQGDPALLAAVLEKKPTVFESPLVEGNTGIFTLRPVFSDKRYLGMVYVIVLK